MNANDLSAEICGMEPPVAPVAGGGTDILLSTINARYIHASVGLRYLLANLGELRERARIVEFEIKQKALEIASELLSYKPRIIGMGVYIWNTALTAEVVAILKRVSPETVVIVGGPEVSYELDTQPLLEWVDYVITGEADLKFAEVCREILAGRRASPKVIVAELPPMERVQFPYAEYTEEDLAHRVLYVEASRGCPFTCEFCLSSLDVPVRGFVLERFLAELEALMARGARVFKFIDRTFNLNINTSRAILQFFLDRWIDGMFVHFEMVPDRMPEALLALLGQFPKGAVQLEVGIQTFDEATAKNISRRQNYAKLEQNLRYLRAHTGVHIHADLIAGLPGETLESFGRGFDRLVAMEPQEIQVGILKRLRGTPIVRHDREWGMVYSPHPPYEILQNRLMSFETLQRLRRFARFWDLLANSGRFADTLPLLWKDNASPFERFLGLSDWLWETAGRQHSIALVSLAEYLYRYLSGPLGQDGVAEVLRGDWFRGGIKREHLPFLDPVDVDRPVSKRKAGAAARQKRHL
ncbi:MAG: radical SAM protein [Verrucomicrobiota bacterium]